MNPPPPPVALTIAGSDCSAGAGLQADLKTFSAHGVYGLTVVTCIVSEIPGKVSRIQAAEASMVRDQLEILLQGFPVQALKTGMLYSTAIIEQIADVLEAIPAGRRPQIVVDPVMVATSGDRLLLADAVAAYESRLFPMAAVITPNLDEAAVLLGRTITQESELAPAAAELQARYGCAVLLKGGHLRGTEALDWLHHSEGTQAFRAPFIPNVSTHGTGCTYAAAITSRLALGDSLAVAVAAGGLARRERRQRLGRPSQPLGRARRRPR